MSEVAEYLERLFTAMDRGQSVADIMREDERIAGYKVVRPGEVPWLSVEDWDPSVVVSIDGDRVRLVAILARSPRQGAFRRLVAAIESHGLTPQVIAPTWEMRSTVQRWGWRKRIKGSGFEAQEIWYPRSRHTAGERDG